MKTKICTNPKCRKEKELTKFRKNCRVSSGINSWCKKCEYNLKKEYLLKNPWIKYLYRAKQRCNNPNTDAYKYYGKKGIECYLNIKDIKFLWFRDKTFDMKKPSISRKNHDKNYTISNCKFDEYINNIKERNQRIKGKPILQFDLEGNFLREWESIKEATKYTGVNNISTCCRGIYKQSGGYKWTHKHG